MHKFNTEFLLMMTTILRSGFLKMGLLFWEQWCIVSQLLQEGKHLTSTEIWYQELYLTELTKTV